MVRIITDSAADLEPQEYAKLNITCIPLNVAIGDQDYQENVTLSKDLFYSLLAEKGGFPKTSQAAPQVVLDLYEDAKRKGDEVVHITLSSAISGTYQTARAMRDDVEYEGIHVVDSKNATGGQRMLVQYAAKLRDEGKSAKEIVYAVKALRSRVVLYACMDTLEYLYLGGRISKTVYKLGKAALKSPPRPWACARAWICCARSWISSFPIPSSPSMPCTPATGPAAKRWPRRSGPRVSMFPMTGSSM